MRKRIIIKPTTTLRLGPPSQRVRDRAGVQTIQTLNTITNYFHPVLVPRPHNQFIPATRQAFLDEYFTSPGQDKK